LTLDLIAPGRAKHSLTRVRRFAFKVQQFTGVCTENFIRIDQLKESPNVSAL